MDPDGAASHAPITTLVARLAPSGRVSVALVDGESLVGTPPAVVRRISDAFAGGPGRGLLHLGAAELSADLHPSLAFWRELGRRFVVATCQALDPTDPATAVVPAVDLDALEALAETAPPMVGAELIDGELLADRWRELGEALHARAGEHEGGVQGYLSACSPVWHVAGRVCLHLAENKRDPDYPFAFIATYARHVPGSNALQYLPLARALKEYSGARRKRELLALLEPLSRAAGEVELVRELLETGDIYHPLAWTPADAYPFLQAIPALERAGLVVRLPDWWAARPRPRVTVTVGDTQPSRLGLESMLDFQLRVTLGGDELSRAELEELLQASAGLVLVKGRWVEVDPDRLREVLDHWRSVAREAELNGVDFAKAMRLLAGTEAATRDDAVDAPEADWAEVVAGEWLTDQLRSLRSPEISQAIAEGSGIRATLRPYQQVGVQWLWTLRTLGLGGCLADDMGLGKTLQVIALIALLDADEAAEDATDLVVVPASLIDNWRSELARFAPQLRVLVAHPSRLPSASLKALSASEVQAHDVVITTYGTTLRTPWMRELGWRCVVLDEAQAIKNPGAKQTRSVKRLRARWRLALTGTPVENRLGDLWSIFDFLNPGLLGSAADFGRLTKALAKRRGDGYAPLRKLVSPYILRRLKTDKRVIADLPDKTEVVAHCYLTRAQAALYGQSVEELAAALEGAEGVARRGLVLAFLTRFKQICNHPSQWTGDGAFDPAQSGKFLRLAELCEPIAARQDKALVFTQYRKMTEPLSRHLAGCFGRPGLVLHGGTPVAKRAELVRRFQEGDAPFMVLSLKAAGTGLNLTAANHVVHFDRWWNPAVENQATDRAFRIGQKRNVLVHKFVCEGTVEERIDELIASKQSLSDQVLAGGGEVKLTELSDEELLDLVRLDLRSVMP